MKTPLTIALAACAPAMAQCPIATITPSGFHNEVLGAGLDVHGTIGIVGAPGREIIWDDVGRAYVFDATNGNVLMHLEPGDTHRDKFFGRSVALHGNLAAIGAHADDVIAEAGGAMYLFDLTTGNQLAKVYAPNPLDGALLGYSVDTWGGWAIAGAPYDDNYGQNAGGAYLYEQITGNFLRDLAPPVRTPEDKFGWKVVADNGVALVGAPDADHHAPNAGAIYVFDLASGAFLRELLPANPSPNDGFGRNFSVEGGRAAVAAGNDRILLFDVVTGIELNSYPLVTEFPDGAHLTHVALDGNNLLVGQSFGTEANFRAGRALLFDVNSGDLIATFQDEEGLIGDGYGRSVAVEASRLYIASPQKNGPVASDQGALYLFERCISIGTPYCPAVSNSSGQPAVLHAWGSTTASENSLVLDAHQLPVGQFGMFLVSETQDFVPGAGGSQGDLCLGGQIGRFRTNIVPASDNGTMSRTIDLMTLPLTPVQAVQAGETWNFQTWFRDQNPGSTSNFSEAIAVSFL